MKDFKPEFEEKRKAFLDNFKRQKKINMFILVAALVVLIVLFIMLQKYQVALLVVAAVIIIGLLIYTQFTKKSLNKRTMDYIQTFYEMTTDAALDHAGLTEFIRDTQAEILREEVEKAEIIKNISFVKSRNVLNGKINNLDARLADLLFKVNISPKESKVVFCGKFIQVSLDKMYKEKVVMYLKPATEATGPDMLDDVHGVLTEDKYVVYCSDDVFVKEHKALVKAFAKLEIDSNLLDATLTIVKDTLTIALSYADNIMVVPLYEELNVAGFSKYAEDLSIVAEIIGSVNKKNRKAANKEELVAETTPVLEINEEQPLEVNNEVENS